MPFPDPDMYPDWRLWAKAVNQQSKATARVEDNWIAEFQPITTFHGVWTPSPTNPPGYCLLKNGFVALCGALEATDQAIYGNILSLPDAARPLYGHYPGSGTPFSLYSLVIVAGGTAARVYCGIFDTGVMNGLFVYTSTAMILHLEGITYRGAVAR